MASSVYVLRVTEGLSPGQVCLGVYSSETAAKLALMLASDEVSHARFTIEALPLDAPLRFPPSGPKGENAQTLAKAIDCLRKVLISTSLAREMRATLDEPDDELEELFETGALSLKADAATERIEEVIANLTC